MSEFNSKYIRTARTIHVCDLCGMHIQKGERYHNLVGKYEGDFYDMKFHQGCYEALEAYWDEYPGEEWTTDWVMEYVNDELRSAGLEVPEWKDDAIEMFKTLRGHEGERCKTAERESR